MGTSVGGTVLSGFKVCHWCKEVPDMSARFFKKALSIHPAGNGDLALFRAEKKRMVPHLSHTLPVQVNSLTGAFPTAIG